MGKPDASQPYLESYLIDVGLPAAEQLPGLQSRLAAAESERDSLRAELSTLRQQASSPPVAEQPAASSVQAQIADGIARGKRINGEAAVDAADPAPGEAKPAPSAPPPTPAPAAPNYDDQVADGRRRGERLNDLYNVKRSCAVEPSSGELQ
jgi:hypothetical protein